MNIFILFHTYKAVVFWRQKLQLPATTAALDAYKPKLQETLASIVMNNAKHLIILANMHQIIF